MQAEKIVEFPGSGRMTADAYEHERAALRAAYGESSREAAALRDQALAKLFYRSSWTQEELAKVEGKSQSWIERRLRFGRFLDFTPIGVNAENLPKNLSEGRFRSYWERTDKSETNERIRFKQVRDLIEQSSLYPPPRPKICEAIVKGFGDGKWHGLATIAKRVDATEEHVKDTLFTMGRRGAAGATCERKQVGTSWSYRIFRKEKPVSSVELAEKLGPIIEGLIVEGKKTVATVSPGTVAKLAALLKRHLEEWTQ
jgi:hypothetical protein